MVGYIHTCSRDREERPLDIPNCVQDVVELNIHRVATVALMVAQVHSGHMHHHLVGLPEGQELVDHDGSQEGFDEAANAIVDLVPAEEVIEESTERLGP
jgi:predicted NAD/FAD-binding protein